MTKQNNTQTPVVFTRRALIRSSIAVGIIAGCIFGIAVGNLVLGLGIGVLLGLTYVVSVGAGSKKQNTKK